MMATSTCRIFAIASFLVLQFALSSTVLNAVEPASLEARDLVSLRIACAESELAVARVAERLAAWRNRGHARLYREGHGSWTQQAEAELAYQVAVARRVHSQRYCEWLKAFAAGNAHESNHLDAKSSSRASDRIELMIPGSRAVIGWIRPMGLPPESRSAILDLMRRRADACRIDPQTLDHSIRGVEAAEAAVRSLKSVTESASEGEHAELKRDLAVTELQRTRADRDLREFEFQRLNQLADVSLVEDPDVDHEAEAVSKRLRVALFRQAREILDREIGQQGVAQAARVSTEWTRFRHQAVLRLRESQPSTTDASMPTFAPITELGATQADARRDWLSQWLSKLDAAADVENLADAVVHSEHQSTHISQTVSRQADMVDILPIETVPHEFRRDLPSCKRLLDLLQEWYRACANVAAARSECEFRSELLTRVSTSARSNPQESAQLRYIAESRQAELRIAEDDQELIVLLIRHVLESPLHSAEPASNLSLIDAESSHILMQMARQRASAVPDLTSEAMTRAKSRRDSLVELQRQGQASRAEVQAAELLVRQAELRWRASDQWQRLAEIDARLMAKILDLRTSHATTETNGK